MAQTLYQVEEDGSISFKAGRKAWGVDIPAYAYDIWMPLIGLRPIGVYGLVWRLARDGQTKGIGLRKLALKARMGDRALKADLELLQECGFIKIETGGRRDSNCYTVLDIPMSIPAELIEKYRADSGYTPLCPWLVEDFIPAGEKASSNDDTPSSNDDRLSPSDDAIIEPSVEPSLSLLAASGQTPAGAASGEAASKPAAADSGQGLSSDRLDTLKRKREAQTQENKGKGAPNISAHPMTLYFKKAFGLGDTGITKEMQNVLGQPFTEVDEAGNATKFQSLCDQWDKQPGFAEFVRCRLDELAAARNSGGLKITPVNALRNLRHMYRPGTDGQKPGFFAWAKLNPSITNPAGSPEQATRPVFAFPTVESAFNPGD